MPQTNKIFIVSECGINHNGILQNAKEQILLSKYSGADAVKFQFYDPDDILKNTPYIEIAKECKVNDAGFMQDTKAYADYLGIEWFVSVFHPWCVDVTERLGVERYKIASRKNQDFALMKVIAKTKKPVIMSVGDSNGYFIKTALDIMAGNKVSLLYCVAGYPTTYRQINFQEIENLKRYGVEVGFSSHCPQIRAGIEAANRGAKILEFHTTVDRRLSGPDQTSSLTYEELRELTRKIRKFEKNPGLSVMPGGGNHAAKKPGSNLSKV